MDATYIRQDDATASRPSYVRYFIRGIRPWRMVVIPQDQISPILLRHLSELDVNEACDWNKHVVTRDDKCQPGTNGSWGFAVGTYDPYAEPTYKNTIELIKKNEVIVEGQMKLSVVITFANLPAQMLRHVICKHWLNRGECTFGQSLCKYLHVMPDKETLSRMEYLKRPLWWRKYQNFNIGPDVTPTKRPANRQSGLLKRPAPNRSAGKHKYDRRHRKTNIRRWHGAKPKEVEPASPLAQDVGDLIDIRDTPMRDVNLDELEVDHSEQSTSLDYPCLKPGTE